MKTNLMKSSKKFYILLESFPNLKEIIALHKEENPTAANFKLIFNKDIYGNHILEYEVSEEMKLTNIPQRVRINIQSSHDPQYHLNWKVGIAIAEPNIPGTARVFFTEGDLVSTQIFTRYLHPC